MPTKKKTSPARRKTAGTPRKTASSASKAKASTKPTGVSAAASARLKQLYKTIDQLTARLEKETKARAAASLIISEAKKARDTVMGQVKSLREQGARLSKELKKALSDSDRREAARQQAMGKLTELRAELAHRTEELRRKSEELAKLAKESAGRAKNLTMSEGSAEAPHNEEHDDEPASPVKETESVTEETEEKEESPRESSIERELHPERKGEPEY